MYLAADYPFLDIVGTMLIFFFWVMWFWTIIIVLTDVYGRHDISGWGKAGWTMLVIVLPLLGVLVYLIAHGSSMAERRAEGFRAQQEAMDTHIRSVATTGDGGSASQIAAAKDLLDSGAINQAEYEQLKQKALA